MKRKKKKGGKKEKDAEEIKQPDSLYEIEMKKKQGRKRKNQ